jgi:PAS domain-containing protein
MPIENHINIFKSFWTWILEYNEKNQVKVLLAAIIVILVVNNFLTQRSYEKKVAVLEAKVERLESLNKTNIELEKRINQLTSDIVIFKAASDFFPFAYWIKDLNGKMVYCNKGFEKKYITNRKKKISDFIGHYDFENWTVAEATAFAKTDSIVITEDRAITFTEKEGKRIITTTKFPYRLNGQTIGVAGVEYEVFKL